MKKLRIWLLVSAAVLLAVLLPPPMFERANGTVCGQGYCPYGGDWRDCAGAYDPGNCTCYAWQKAHGDGWEFPSDLCGPGGECHAYRWDEAARAYGYGVGTIPHVGSIAVWEPWADPAYGLGHVGYVTSVGGDADDSERISFGVSHMNLYNYRYCVYESTYNTGGMGENLHFIYPPSDTPVPLWPYEGIEVEYGDQIVLLWYGGAEYYDIQFDVQEKDSNNDPIGSRYTFALTFNVPEESFNLYELEDPVNLRYLVDGTWYWRIRESGDT